MIDHALFTMADSREDERSSMIIVIDACLRCVNLLR